LLEIPQPPSRLSWEKIFANDQPLEIEVGCGKGLFLITAASAQTSVNFLGIEISRMYQLFTASRLARRKLQNVLLVRADARQFFRDYVADGSCRAIHVYFPDPWWKRRHEKRRLLTAEFCAQSARILIPGGCLRIATDVEDYSRVARRLVAQCRQFREVAPIEPKDAQHDLDYLTNFERKFRKQGRVIHRLQYARVSHEESAGNTR
jgi:tRNA (guanine-N7-)-methyltransferase